MLRQCILVLCVFLRECRAQNAASLNTRPPEIGNGITAQIYVYYDSSYTARISAQALSDGSTEKSQERVQPSFQALFQQVQEHFHNKSVMINFQLNTTAKDDSIGVLFHGMERSLNASATLQSLIKKKHSEAERLDAIVYYFTMHQLLEENNRGDRIPRTVTYKSTKSTFCTTSPSAAVVSQDLQSKNIVMTLAATSDILGCTYRPRGIHPREKENMKKRFGQCLPRS